jgi:diaminopimelate epimerase
MHFLKLTGAGNDFIATDNRKLEILKRKQAAVRLCERKFGIGADGLLLLEKSAQADFRMRIFNPDGSEAEMCGNGLRCILRFAVETNIVRKRLIRVETMAGVLEGQVSGKTVKAQLNITGKPRLDMKIPLGRTSITGHFLNTGVPHTAILTDDINKVNLQVIGSAIRYHKIFEPKGTNVDWIETVDKHHIKIRTYERGVEGETLSCGTGSVAGAIISFLLGRTSPPVKVLARSGETLTVDFNPSLERIYLEGKIAVLFKGQWLGR